jgi:uncharacterized protein
MIGFDLILILFAFFTAVIDIIFGMGFGLTMTPILIFLSYSPKEIVPALLLSSLIGNILSSYFNHRFKNADFSLGTRSFNIVVVIGFIGVLGSVFGALMNEGISNTYLSLYIGAIITGSGFFILLKKKMTTVFSWFKVIALSLFGSFNKGISGSGFGPIITTGLLYMGVKEKEAVSIQGFAELFVSLIGFSTFLISGASINWALTTSIGIGVAAAAPLAAFMVQKTESGKLRDAIGFITIILGSATIAKIFM